MLLDTLLRPNLDTGLSDRTCVEWRYEPENVVSHLVLGDASRAGGQWAEEPTSGDWDARALSYAEMLSLPEYTFDKHHQIRTGHSLPPFERPTRRLVADYYAAYPKAVGIADAIRNDTHVKGVSRTLSGFYVGSHQIHCKRLVLASGIFKDSVPPPPLLRPIRHLNEDTLPLLVIGSGFSAADAIIAARKSRNIIHIFKWMPEDRPSPLRGCHKQAYPEYASVYRQMRLAAIRNGEVPGSKPGQTKQSKSGGVPRGRDWIVTYEGLPNANITDVKLLSNSATVKLSLADGTPIARQVGGLAYLVGRAGSLDYLEPGLHAEILAAADQSASVPGGSNFGHVISGRTFRAKAQENLQVVPGVFVAGSLTGDSLVRYAFGGCVQIAGILMSNGNRHSAANDGSQDAHGPFSATNHNIAAAATAAATNAGGIEEVFDGKGRAGNPASFSLSRTASSSNSSSSINTQDTQGTCTTHSTPNNETSNEPSGDENGSVNAIYLRPNGFEMKLKKRKSGRTYTFQNEHEYYSHPPDSTMLYYTNKDDDSSVS